MLHHAAVEGVCDDEQAASSSTSSNDDRNDCVGGVVANEVNGDVAADAAGGVTA